MYKHKFQFYFVTLVSLLLGAWSVQTIRAISFETRLLNNHSAKILAFKSGIKPKLNDSALQNNKGFLDDIKEGFEDIKDDAVDVGEDIKDDAVDVGEDVKDDAVDVGEDIKKKAI